MCNFIGLLLLQFLARIQSLMTCVGAVFKRACRTAGGANLVRKPLVLLFLMVVGAPHLGAAQMNYFDLFMRDIPELLSQKSDLFVSMGMNLYRGFSIIMLAWFGAELVMGGKNGSRLLPLLWMIALVGTMLTFYSTPIPGVGRGFRQMITDQALDMSKIISNGDTEAVMKRLQTFENAPGIVPAGVFDVSGSLRQLLFSVVIALAQAVTIAIIAFSFLAAGVAGLVGPFFIPFFLVPGMEWMAWGWLKSFIQYSFYGVVANSYTFVMRQALANFCPQCGADATTGDIAVQFVEILVLLIAYIYGMVQIPSLVNSLFSGRSGERAFWRL